MASQNENVPDFSSEESLRVQKAEWVRTQLEAQRQNDARAWERLVEEQKALNERNLSIESDMNRNRHLQRYEQECVEDLRAQVYALHGISEDKLEGMQAYKDARYQGMAAAVFVISLAMTVVGGFFFGVLSEVTLFMLGCLGIEGALLSQEGRRGKFLDAVCRFLYMLPLPAMLAVFFCYMMEFPIYKNIMYWGVIAAAAILVIGTVSYFVHNPYRRERRNIREARADLKEVEQNAKKAVRRNQKLREKEEKRAALQAARDEKRTAAQVARTERRAASLAEKESKKAARLQAKQEKGVYRKDRWNQFKQNCANKWTAFKSGIQQKKEMKKLEKARLKAENANAQIEQLQAQVAAAEAASATAAAPSAATVSIANGVPEAKVIETDVTATTGMESATAEITAEENVAAAVGSEGSGTTATIISINGEKCKQA